MVLTPTRRGARALAEAFVGAAGGQAVLLPQIRALGDLEEGEPPFEPGDLALDLPPAIAPLRRRFELARLVAEHEPPARPPRSTPPRRWTWPTPWPASSTPADRGGGEPLEQLDGLVEGELAEHWQVSRAVPGVAADAWPERLARARPGRRRRAPRAPCCARLAEQWTDQPPHGVLIAAGSTGTAPADRRPAAPSSPRAPQGCVVLPGLDRTWPTRPGRRWASSIRRAR